PSSQKISPTISIASPKPSGPARSPSSSTPPTAFPSKSLPTRAVSASAGPKIKLFPISSTNSAFLSPAPAPIFPALPHAKAARKFSASSATASLSSSMPAKPTRSLPPPSSNSAATSGASAAKPPSPPTTSAKPSKATTPSPPNPSAHSPTLARPHSSTLLLTPLLLIHFQTLLLSSHQKIIISRRRNLYLHLPPVQAHHIHIPKRHVRHILRHNLLDLAAQCLPLLPIHLPANSRDQFIHPRVPVMSTVCSIRRYSLRRKHQTEHVRIVIRPHPDRITQLKIPLR